MVLSQEFSLDVNHIYLHWLPLDSRQILEFFWRIKSAYCRTPLEEME